MTKSKIAGCNLRLICAGYTLHGVPHGTVGLVVEPTEDGFLIDLEVRNEIGELVRSSTTPIFASDLVLNAGHRHIGAEPA